MTECEKRVVRADYPAAPPAPSMRLKHLYRITVLLSSVIVALWVVFLEVRFLGSRLHGGSQLYRDTELQVKHAQSQSQNGWTLKNAVEGGALLGLKQRRRHLLRHCLDASEVKLVSYGGVKMANTQYDDSQGRLLVCFSPHLAPTFWEDLLQALDIRTRSPNQNFRPNSKAKDPRKTGIKALFVQNPYARLVSVYTDLLVLPQAWKSLALRISSLFHSSHLNVRPRCVTDVAFEDFLHYVTYLSNDENTRLRFADSRWLPQSSACNSCSVGYNFVGKIETLSEDVEFLVGVLNADLTGNSKPIIEEVLLRSINQTIEQSWLSEIDLEECQVTSVDLMRRLWATFRHRGLLPHNSSLELDGLLSLKGHQLKETFRRYVIREAGSHKLMTSALTEEWRAEELRQVYEHVPEELKYRIRDMFKYDFELFGYEKEPGYIFTK